MPWKESCHVNERMRFVTRLEEGEGMAELCREFGISRKTGYKFLSRFKQLGPIGLFDRPPIAERIPHRTSAALVERVVEARGEHPTWGARKLRGWLLEKEPQLRLPAASTMGEWLHKRGLLQPRRPRQRVPPSLHRLQNVGAPNELWCADFKGQFRLGNGRYCYPLTITDAHSRYVLGCEALDDTRGEAAKAVFELTFREVGLPSRIRTDNGAPFATRGLAGLSRLSVWWMRLGIEHERIEPGHPEQNGRHERMHRTLKAETTRPAASTALQQQERFDRFVAVFNHERPHEALGQRPPTTVYAPSQRLYPERLPEPEYPLHDDTLMVSRCGHIRMGGRRGFRVFLAVSLAAELVGIRELQGGRWLVSFSGLDLGVFDQNGRLDPTPSPVISSNLKEPVQTDPT